MNRYSKPVLACGLLVTATLMVGAPRGDRDPQDNKAPATIQTPSAEPGSQPRTAVILRFAVESEPANDTSALSEQACPASAAAASSTTPTPSVTVDPNILDTISEQMQAKLSKKMSVMVDPNPTAIPIGALTISGCIMNANGGNAAKRLIGMNMGASRLAVHVVALSRTKDGWSPIDNFDIQVKGGDVLPPLGPAGLALHLAKDPHQNLSADAKKLADCILKKLSQDMKAREKAAKNA